MVSTAIALLLAGFSGQTTADAAVPFRLAESAIVVDATINGKKVPLVFDSGFGDWVQVEDSVGIGKSTGTETLNSFLGPFEADAVPLKTLKIGARTIPVGEGQTALQMEAGFFEGIGYGTDVSGLLGIRAFEGQPVEINFQKHEFIFHPKSMDISKRVPDNKRTFLLKMLPTGFESIMLEVDAKSGQKMNMAIDTGNWFYAITYSETLRRIGAWEPGKKPKFFRSSERVNADVTNWTKKMTDMTIFGVPVPLSYWDVIEGTSTGANFDGTMGFGFLCNFNVTFDFDRRRVWLENFTGKTAGDEPGDVGLSYFIKPNPRRVIVAGVDSDSPAELAGIRPGDQLVTIEGEKLQQTIGVFELRHRMEGLRGTKIKLGFFRNGQTIDVELERAFLVNE